METAHIDLHRCPAAGAEDFRLLKRNVMRGDGRAGGPILVTSALPGEGKTFCAAHLALAMAQESEHTVLLVDGNVIRPGVLPMLGLEAAPGLVDVLLDGEALLPSVFLHTSVPRLTLLPAGRQSPRAAELLASRAMRRLLHEIANRYPDRSVVIDSPPMLTASIAAELAEQAARVLVVVEAHRTPQHALQESLRRLSHHEDVAIVCNRVAHGASFAWPS